LNLIYFGVIFINQIDPFTLIRKQEAPFQDYRHNPATSEERRIFLFIDEDEKR
jgi:hypothetical protein